ncbi:GLUG motif-containing protein [Fictibacillus gelatini]|uniref:GLUG motif-containing protein n=1 Tax=Fictibacillus gelatini TaxID=225985 RepID=UPI000417B647|nr:GLUG motif-containing protein [Fictibacillus gelatini]
MAILISTPQDLHNVRNNLTGAFELANDIDMSNFGNFTPIGTTSAPFKGTFDGKGHKIKNLSINVTSGYSGLFSYVSTSTVTIKNVGLENCNINGNDSNWAGGIVGSLVNGTITNCYVTGQVTGRYMVGGIVGQFTGGTISNCYSKANVTAYARVGGLIGYVGGTTCKIINCYSTGKAKSTEVGTSFPAGGLIGDNVSVSTVTNSYWDTETSGLTYSAGGVGKTTAELKTQSTYTGWDFTSTWAINNNYPYLKVFGVPANIGNVKVDSFVNNLNVSLTKTIKANKNTESIIKPILTYTDKKKRTNRNVLTYTLPIDSNSLQSHRTVRSSTQNVTSFINPISALVERRTKTIQNLLTYVSPLQAHTDVLIPLNTNNVANAFTSVIENPLMATYIGNMSALSVIKNPSYVEVIK